MTSPDSVSDARNSVLMAGVSKEHRILEVGASFGPPAPKREGWKTYTVDHEANENLVEKYVGADIRPEEIEEVDIVWREGHSTMQCREKSLILLQSVPAIGGSSG